MGLGLLPGADGHRVEQVFGEVHNDVRNIRTSAGSDPDRMLMSYLLWARSSADRLASLIGGDEISRLIQTPTYWALLTVAQSRGAVYPTVQAELDSRALALEQARDQLRADRARWQQGFGGVVVLDTGVFIEHRLLFPESLAAIEAEIAPLDTGQFAGGDPIQFVIPLQVVDELDMAKADRSRGRAIVALAALNKIFATPTSVGTHPGLRAESKLHLLLDDRGHSRLPVADDEIVDRALYVSSMAGAPVGVAMMDTGMDLRTRSAGLQSYLLTDRRPEPGKSEGKR